MSVFKPLQSEIPLPKESGVEQQRQYTRIVIERFVSRFSETEHVIYYSQNKQSTDTYS